MDENTRKRLRPILENSKRGKPNTRGDDAFAEKCWRKWPSEYAEFRNMVVGEVNRSINPFSS
jgi:hypothetical protein